MPRNFHLFLKGTVGDAWFSDFNVDFVNYVLEKHKGSQVNVLIHSLGGYTGEGMAISSLFKIHGDVHVHFIGMSASAATIAAMGAKHISIDADAAFLVHKCSSYVRKWEPMNADQIDNFIGELEKRKSDQQTLDNCVAGLYARRCKKSSEELMQLMSKDTWLTAQQALEWGFVDEITDDKEDKEKKPSESVLSSMSAAGMPLPPGVSVRKRSVRERFLDFMNEIFHNQQPEASDPDADGAQNISQSQMDTQNSKAQQPQQAQQPQEAQQPQSSAQQPAAQQQAPAQSQQSDTLSDKDREIADLKAQLAAKDAQIASLGKQPAETTSSVVDSDKSAPDKYAPVSEAEAIAASKAFLENY